MTYFDAHYKLKLSIKSTVTFWKLLTEVVNSSVRVIEVEDIVLETETG